LPTKLCGPWLKIERAHQHINELQDAINAFIKRDVCRLLVEDDPEGSGQVFTVRLYEQPPYAMPLIIGDAAHNLRSALDLMACELVRANNGNISHVNFPFARNKDAFPKALAESHIKRAGTRALDFIKLMEPYHGGHCEQLALLHDLDIADKHRLILPVLSMAKIGSGHFPGADLTGTIFDFQPPLGAGASFGIALKDGAQFASQTFLPRLKDVNEIKPSFDVVFGEGPFERNAVIPTLNQLADFVWNIVQDFAAL
jgi:hypothetical protein